MQPRPTHLGKNTASALMCQRQACRLPCCCCPLRWEVHIDHAARLKCAGMVGAAIGQPFQCGLQAYEVRNVKERTLQDSAC